MKIALQEKGFNALGHYHIVRKFIPVHQAMKIPDAKAAVDKGWEKLEKLRAKQMTKAKSKNKSSKRHRKSKEQLILLR